MIISHFSNSSSLNNYKLPKKVLSEINQRIKEEAKLRRPVMYE